MTDYSSHDAINEDLKDRLFDIDVFSAIVRSKVVGKSHHDVLAFVSEVVFDACSGLWEQTGDDVGRECSTHMIALDEVKAAREGVR